MISKDLREAIAKIDKLQEALKHIELLELLPDLLDKMDKLQGKEPQKSYKEKIETKRNNKPEEVKAYLGDN
jgi:uncharacterized spore protein YtfJ